MPTITVSLSELKTRLAAVKGAQPIGFSALVDSRARKTGNPHGEILKLSRVSAFTGFDYEASVNRQLDREGKTQLTFAAAERSWGTRIAPALVENKGEFYLVAKVEKTRKPIYLVRNAAIGGALSPIAKSAIAQFLPEVKPAANQGTDKEIVYRNYALRNLVSLSIGGEVLRVRHGNA